MYGKNIKCSDKKFIPLLSKGLDYKWGKYIEKFYLKLEKIPLKKRVIIIDKIIFKLNILMENNKKNTYIFLHIKQKLDLKKREYIIKIEGKNGNKVFIKPKKNNFYINGDNLSMDYFCRENNYRYNVYHGIDSIKYLNKQIVGLKYNRKKGKFEKFYTKKVSNKVLCTNIIYN